MSGTRVYGDEEHDTYGREWGDADESRGHCIVVSASCYCELNVIDICRVAV